MTRISLFIVMALLMLFSASVLATGGGTGGGGSTGASVPTLGFSMQIAIVVLVAYIYRKRK